MNANVIFANFLNKLNTISTIEEKEYAMIEAYDDLDAAGYNDAEKRYIWNQMMAAA